MSLAVAFIGTGKYLTFFDEWYSTAKKFLAADTRRTFLVFSDGLPAPSDDVVEYLIPHEPWPYVTLKRWQTLRLAEDVIAAHKHFLYLDADMKIDAPISYQELFRPDQKYTGVEHPAHWMKWGKSGWPGSFETNPASLAAVTEDMDHGMYWQGCLWGGESAAVLKMLRILQARTADDLARGVIAKWHDESHLNRFFIDHKPDVFTLSSGFAYPSQIPGVLNVTPRIWHLDKNNTLYRI
jgi:hypothetical protein